MKTESKLNGNETLARTTREILAELDSGRRRYRPLPAPTQLANFSLDFKRVVAENAELKSEIAVLKAALAAKNCVENLQPTQFSNGERDVIET